MSVRNRFTIEIYRFSHTCTTYRNKGKVHGKYPPVTIETRVKWKCKLVNYHAKKLDTHLYNPSSASLLIHLHTHTAY